MNFPQIALFSILLLSVAEPVVQQDRSTDATEDADSSLLQTAVLPAGSEKDRGSRTELQEPSGEMSAVKSCITKAQKMLSSDNSKCWMDCGTQLSPAAINLTACKAGGKNGCPFQMESYIALARDPSVKTICETGFWLGHSSALWLCANPNATLYSFDLEFPNSSLSTIQARFGERFVHLKGDSMKTLTKFAQQTQPPECDLMIMDGGHFDPLPKSDLKNFATISRKSKQKRRTLVVDEIFFDWQRYVIGSYEEPSCCQDMTDNFLAAWHKNMFDNERSKCSSYDGQTVVNLTPAGMHMFNLTFPYGGWCELVFRQ